VLGVPLVTAAPGFAWSKLPNSSQFEVFGPAERDHGHFTTGPVPEFLVEDVFEAAAELEAAGVELLGPPQARPRKGGSTSAPPTATSTRSRAAPPTGAEPRCRPAA